MIKNQSITVSVLMAIFNTPFELAKRAIDSVLNQDFQNFEMIILDDGSEELLGRKLFQYSLLHPLKITYVRHPNCGQSESINRGVKIARGEYITIIDSDDEYKPNHLTACINGIGDSDLISSLAEIIVNKEEDYFVPDKDDHSKSIHVDDCILFATLFGRNEVFRQLSFKSMYAADNEFYEKAQSLFKVKKIDLRTYVYYRNRMCSITGKLKRDQ
ncbi:hypothetical protein BH09BAC5_BH09BAC5_05890 [soil metagenome]